MNEQETINVLDLFSGIGGFSLGLERAGPFRTVAFCEREPFPQAVLRKHWPDVPIYDDVRTIDTDRLGRIDLICGGFPCQPWSVAGQQRGAEDDRDLWPVMASLIEDLRPRWVVGENVRGFVNQPLGLQRSLSNLESLGYQTAPFVIPACAVNAPHRRDRVWIVAHTSGGRENVSGERGSVSDEIRDGSQEDRRRHDEQHGPGSNSFVAHADHTRDRAFEHATVRDRAQTDKGQEEQSQFESGRQSQNVAHASQLQRDVGGERTEQGERQVSQSRKRGGADDVADAECERRPGQGQLVNAVSSTSGASWQAVEPVDGGERGIGCAEPGMGGVVDGVPRWMDEPDCGRVATGVKNREARLKALGNAVVPQVVAQIGKAILAGENGLGVRNATEPEKSKSNMKKSN